MSAIPILSFFELHLRRILASYRVILFPERTSTRDVEGDYMQHLTSWFYGIQRKAFLQEVSFTATDHQAATIILYACLL